MADERWVEVTPSQFAHEKDGLRRVRDLMPDTAPYRAWTNFEFRDERGTWSEVDLLLLTPIGLHLVELKYYSGRLRGTDQTWLRDGHAPEDSPLLLANRKAKRLRTKLMAAYDDFVRTAKTGRAAPPARKVIPFIQAAVFLHHPELVCELPGSAAWDLYGLPGNEQRSGLESIAHLFDATSGPEPVHENAIAELMGRIGVRAGHREAGSYVLDRAPFEDGPGWQDWLGTHKLMRSQRRRIRFQLVPEGSPQEVRLRARQLAAHEMQVMQRLSHDAIVRPEDFVDSELGPGLIYPYDPAWQRLDLWLADQPQGLPFDTQVSLVRQIAEALQYAHGKNVVHRALGPHAVLVRTDGSGNPRVALTDWQVVGRRDGATGTAQATHGVTELASPTGLAPAPDRWAIEGFAAPEGILGGGDRLRLDVFGLGALAFYLLTGGRHPAMTRADLAARLRAQGGLDVSVELPAIAPALREVVLDATRPRVSDRLPDVGAFLSRLDDATCVRDADEVADPLDARPGAVLDDRFELEHRLGAGSTAVGLLVRDRREPGEPARVLKVALDDAAAGRLSDEADALRKLSSPRIVKLIEGPIDVGGRRALLLASAGPETLATHLGNRERLSLDLLERWGTDLLETVRTLDGAGVSHRDIKPANLGVREDRSGNTNRAKHLVLFDFSLTRAPASDTRAGTRPYLDPFLGGTRPFDSAAERYAAAVVLFEMATGHTPVYGDGLSDPAAISDPASIDPADFDPSARARLVAFFTRALARDVRQRHDTAEQMLLEWLACFPETSMVPDDADQVAEAATAETPLAASGLSPRAISALEQLREVSTVGQLAAIDAVRLNRLPGVSKPTRDEIKHRARQWRERFGRRAHGWVVETDAGRWGDPHELTDVLLDAARAAGAGARRGDKAVMLASLLLGATGSLEANASQAELAAAFAPPVTRARVSQLLSELQRRWAVVDEARYLLEGIATAVDERLAELGGVATFDELAHYLLGLLVGHPESADESLLRRVEGLLRCAVGRRAELARADASDETAEEWLLRRREGRPLLVATRHDLLDLAEQLGRRADALVDEVNPTGTDKLVLAPRAAERLLEIVTNAAELAPTRAEDPYRQLRDGRRLATLAARLSQYTGASATGDLHHRHLGAARALQETLTAIAAGEHYTPEQLRDRVRARFPDLPRLPRHPDLDTVVSEAGLGLRYDETRHAYVAASTGAADTTGLESRPLTVISPSPLLTGPGAVGQRLLDSCARHSFVALGVDARWLDKFADLLRARFDAVEVDLTGVLIHALHETAANLNMPWSVVLGADAESPGSRPHAGLRSLVERSLPAVSEAVERALADARDRPVALLDASLLARYDALGLLASWMDLSTRRPTAIWLVVPQLSGSTGAVVDGRPLPLTAPSQFVSVPSTWIDTYRSIPEGAHA